MTQFLVLVPQNKIAYIIYLRNTFYSKKPITALLSTKSELDCRKKEKTPKKDKGRQIKTLRLIKHLSSEAIQAG